MNNSYKSDGLIIMQNNWGRILQLIEIGRYKEAKKILSDFSPSSEEYPSSYYLLAIIAHKENEYEKCIQYCEAYLAVDPESDAAFYFSGLSHHELGQSARGIRLIEQAMALDPERTAYKISLAQILLQLNHLGKAEEMCRDALFYKPDDATAYAILAEVAMQVGDKKKAIALGEEALRLDPTNKGVQELVGDHALKYKQMGKSAALLGAAVRADPASAALRERYIDAELGKTSPAYRWLAMKGRMFYVADYATVLLQFFIAVMGTLALRKQYEVYEWYAQFKILFTALVLWMIVFWLVRITGHYLYSRRNWKLGLMDFLTVPYLTHLGIILILISAMLHSFTSNFLWVGTMLVVGVFTVVIYSSQAIENRKYRNYLRAYIAFMALPGIAIFYGYWNSYNYAKVLSEILVLSLFGPLVLGALCSAIWDGYKEAKKDRTEKTTVSSVDSHSTRFDKIIGYAFYPLLLITAFIFKFNGVEFYDTGKVVLYCAIGVAITLILVYLAYQRFHPQFLSLTSTTETSEGRASAILRSGLTYIVLSVFLCLSTIVLSSSQSEVWLPHSVVSHNYQPDKSEKNHIVLRAEATKKLRPPKEIMAASSNKDCLELKLEEKLFGIRLIKGYRLCE